MVIIVGQRHFLQFASGRVHVCVFGFVVLTSLLRRELAGSHVVLGLDSRRRGGWRGFDGCLGHRLWIHVGLRGSAFPFSRHRLFQVGNGTAVCHIVQAELFATEAGCAQVSLAVLSFGLFNVNVDGSTRTCTCTRAPAPAATAAATATATAIARRTRCSGASGLDRDKVGADPRQRTLSWSMTVW